MLGTRPLSGFREPRQVQSTAHGPLHLLPNQEGMRYRMSWGMYILNYLGGRLLSASTFVFTAILGGVASCFLEAHLYFTVLARGLGRVCC